MGTPERINAHWLDSKPHEQGDTPFTISSVQLARCSMDWWNNHADAEQKEEFRQLYGRESVGTIKEYYLNMIRKANE